MELLIEHEGRRFFRLDPFSIQATQAPTPARPYAALVWNHGAALPQAEAEELAERLLVTGCLYIVSAGVDCERFHDIVDETDVIRELDHPGEGTAPMTTWHAGESVDDVTFFFAWSTTAGEPDFEDFLILQLGGTAADHQLTESSLAKHLAGGSRYD